MRAAAFAFGTIAMAVIAQVAVAQTDTGGAAWGKTPETSADLALAGIEMVDSTVIQGQKYSILVTFWRDRETSMSAGEELETRIYRCFDLLDRDYTHAHCEVAYRDE